MEKGQKLTLYAIGDDYLQKSVHSLQAAIPRQLDFDEGETLGYDMYDSSYIDARNKVMFERKDECRGYLDENSDIYIQL